MFILKNNTKYEKKYNTYWLRFFSILLDFIIIVILLIPSFFIDDWIYTSKINKSLIIIYHLGTSSIFFWYTILLQGLFGQTIGDRIVKIKVIKQNGEKINLLDSFFRISIYLFFMLLGIYFDIPYIMENKNPTSIEKNNIYYTIIDYIDFAIYIISIIIMLRNSKQRALHDYIAKTDMIRTNVQ